MKRPGLFAFGLAAILLCASPALAQTVTLDLGEGGSSTGRLVTTKWPRAGLALHWLNRR